MKQEPKIIMQCPKCSREFSPEASYCDSCSAMLEPVEISPDQTIAETDNKTTAGDTIVGGENEILDDVKIDSLKSGIEQAFVRTLLLELAHLRKRRSSSEHLRTPRETEPGNAAPQSGGIEDRSGTEAIHKRIIKLEAILHNLEKKMESDISDLKARLNSLKKPGLQGLLNSGGRIYRMLSSELKTKNTVLRMIQTKVPPSPFLRFSRTLRFTITAALILLTIIWIVFSAARQRQSTPVAPPDEAQMETGAEKQISRMDIINLLEDIKTANLKKDLSLWESRYSKNYLELQGKKEDIQGVWHNFDFVALEYRIDRINIQQDTANAQITWNMELRSRKTGKLIPSSQILSADFIRENRTFKISSVRKKER